MSFRMANIWKSFENSKSLDGKFWQKVVFFSRIGRVVGVVLCVLRPSSRLFVKHSTFESTSTHIFDIRLYIRLSLRIYVVKVEVEVR